MKISLSLSKKPKLKKPIMICAWPGMGEVAFKLAVYLKDKLNMEEFASLEAPELFPPAGIWIENSTIQLPKDGRGKFYFYKNKPLLNLPGLKSGDSSRAEKTQCHSSHGLKPGDFPALSAGRPACRQAGAEGLNDLILFISDAQPIIEHASEYVQKILALAGEFRVKRIFTFAAMPQPIDHTANPEVWVASTQKK